MRTLPVLAKAWRSCCWTLEGLCMGPLWILSFAKAWHWLWRYCWHRRYPGGTGAHKGQVCTLSFFLSLGCAGGPEAALCIVSNVGTIQYCRLSTIQYFMCTLAFSGPWGVQADQKLRVCDICGAFLSIFDRWVASWHRAFDAYVCCM